ncbi:MAG: MoaD/ThiS family protein [Dehalococcoidia bacterium]|nr:MoaD/ThiS family protein [Dehalococcoidia bacterium]
MTVTVRLFASVADAAGCRRLDLPLTEGETVAQVRARLLERYPQLGRFVPVLLYALDEEYVADTAVVPDGATLALIPPVSGG